MLALTLGHELLPFLGKENQPFLNAPFYLDLVRNAAIKNAAIFAIRLAARGQRAGA